MAELNSINLGPWSGIDNVHRADAQAFQIRAEPEGRLPALVRATDVDLDDDGWAISRAQTDSVLTFDSSLGLGSWEIDGRFFYQNGGDLYEWVAPSVPLISGLVGRVSICQHWGQIFVTDGQSHYEITGSTVRSWGLPVPLVSLAPASGSLSAGAYLIQASFVDALGNEGGTSDVARVVLSAATGIEVFVSGQSEACVAVNLYISNKDQKATSYLATIGLGAFPHTIQIASITVADPPKTAQMTGPIVNSAGVFSFRAFMLMWRDNVVFRSEGTEPHLFHADNILQFGADVTACEAIADGMWIGTAKGLVWVTGNDPTSWIPLNKSFDSVLRGSATIQGGKIPRLGTNELVALFVTESGLVAGMPGGQVFPLTDNVYTFDPALRASIAYVERWDLRQIFVGLVG